SITTMAFTTTTAFITSAAASVRCLSVAYSWAPLWRLRFTPIRTRCTRHRRMRRLLSIRRQYRSPRRRSSAMPVGATTFKAMASASRTSGSGCPPCRRRRLGRLKAEATGNRCSGLVRADQPKVDPRDESGSPRHAARRSRLPRSQAELRLLHNCFDTWRGIGDIVAGMARQDFDLELRRYDGRGWRALFFPEGFEHSFTSHAGAGWGPSPWKAVQQAARDALAKLERG